MTKPQLQPGGVGRNDACPCGSQKKYKKCCENTAAAAPKPVAHSPSVQKVRPSVAWPAAVEAFQAGNLAQAQTSCEKVLASDPRHADALHLRAMIAFRQEEHQTALQYIQRAIKQVPRSSDFYNSLGLIQQKLDQASEAEKAFRMALQLDPTNAMAHFNLGDLWHAQEKVAEAEACYQKALRYQSNFPEAHNNLGLLRLSQQQFDPAIVHLSQALQLRPDHFKAHLGLSCALREQHRHAQAQAVLEQALRLQPDSAEAWHDLGVTLAAQNQRAASLAAYEKAVQLKPDLGTGYLSIGNIYYERGLTDVAGQYYQRAQAIQPSDALRVKQMLCIPAIYDSTEQLQAERARLAANLDQLMAANLQIKDPQSEVALTPFFLGYHGENELEMMTRIGDFFLQTSPSLGEVAPHCRTPQRTSNRIEIGFLSSSFSWQGIGQNIINRVMSGVIANWPRDQFRVTVLHQGNACSEIVQTLRDGDRLMKVSNSLDTTRQQIGEAKLDILFFCDIGMEPWSYFLSFARLAPLQVTCGGHPLTSGVPNVDYFISSAVDEVSHAQQHYRERVVLMPQRPVCYWPAASPLQVKTRADLGLPENKHIYLCPMTPFKLHPEMDQIIGEVLRADGDGEVVFVINHQTELWERLKQRFARTLPDVVTRIRFLSHLPLPDFIELIRLSDVLLDTTKFNGGTTSLEALAVGTPIVTLPGEFLRQRCTFAMYNAMDWRECIAQDAQDYVRLAAEIARRPEYRAHLKQEILSRKSVLFGQTDWIKPLSDFMVEALEKTLLRT